MVREILKNSSIGYPTWAIFMLILSLVLVDRKKYQYLFLHGILGAFITSIILIFNINIIKSWRYVENGPFSILGVSVFIILAWFATKVLFLWGLPKNTPIWVHYFYIGLFAILGAGIDNIFHDMGLRPYADWYRAWMWFFVLYFNFWLSYKIYLLRKKYID